MSGEFKTAGDSYQAARPAYDSQLFTRLAAFGIGLPGQRIVDLGAGTGLLTLPLLQTCAVLQIDTATALLKASVASAKAAAYAEALPLADAACDCVLAGNCWHWFDRRKAPREIARVLKPAGRIGVVYQTYIPHAGNVAAASEALLAAYLSGWRHANGTGVNGQVLRDLGAAEFTQIESFSYDVPIEFSTAAWDAYFMTHSVLLDAPPVRRAAFAEAHQHALRDWPERVFVPHRCFAVIAHSPTKPYTSI